jgi:diamine N-acetyltransferase
MELQYYRLNPESEKDVNILQKILSAAPGYYLLLEGNLPNPDAALKELKEVPPGKSAYDKFFYGIQLSGKYIGCFDLIRNYPDSKTAFIGLLLLIESEQNKSYGVQVLQYIKNLAKQWGCSRLRLGVIEKNQRALAFWKREGFLELCKQQYKQYSCNVILMEYVMVKIEQENVAKIIRTKVG